MKDQEIDERSIGIVTVGISGFWQRLSFAAHILFLGKAVFGILPENFIEEGVRHSPTCVLRASPEELMAPQTPRMAKLADHHRSEHDEEAEDERRRLAGIDPPDYEDHVCIGDPPDFER